MLFQSYDPGDFYDELFLAAGKPRPEAELLVRKVDALPVEEIHRRQQLARNFLMKMGATFNVYGAEGGIERIIPFDIIPRLMNSTEWWPLERGLKQRITALNCFLQDVYNDQKILKDRVIPEELILSANGFLKPCIGLKPPHGIWCHIAGIDMVRDRDGGWYVLEDNVRCPSGVSYFLENRQVMKRTFPEVFNRGGVLPVDEYPGHLLDTLLHLAPDQVDNPTVVVLSPGIYNSAYFEHAYLAQKMGAELVEGRDLVIADGYLQMRTTRGLKRVDVIYRRIDDEFIDPLAFRPDSLLGIPGLLEVYRQGRVAIANALGTGVADDKVIYTYVPAMIRYYLGEDPILNNVPTFLCWEEDQRAYVLDHLDELVVKAAGESGGYGMLIGPQASEEERQKFAHLIQANPRNYIAQKTLSLSRTPTMIDGELVGCHVDLRPYILCGETINITPGGFTRVAMRKGSLVVNSSQGGGSKDTWVLTGTGDFNASQSQVQS
ncbi:circularly permuted type 2 ATP-grasp protein [Synechococcus elongatus]|uniref:circularly permuted type 2 ATP-grasp protein n=1 Tax=Synechococcus elongatus TaxID=32046 RepID=UPI0030CF0271